MNLDILDAEIYDNQTQRLKLKANTAVLSDDKVSACDKINNNWLLLWTSTSSVIHWDVLFFNTGQLDIAIHLANNEINVGAEIELELDDEKITATIDSFTGGMNSPGTFKLGSFSVKTTGRLNLKMKAKYIEGSLVGKFWYLELSGPAAVDSEEDMIPRSISDVLLYWHSKDVFDILYIATTPIESHMGTEFCSLAFDGGVLKLQAEDHTGYRSVVWDFWPVEENVDMVDLYLAAQNNVWRFPWNVGETYHFLVKVLLLLDSNASLYAGYMYLESERRWKLLVVRKFINSLALIEGPRTFLRWFYGEQMGYYPREAVFGPVWGRVPTGEWKAVTVCDFAQDGTLSNTDAFVVDNRVHVRSGGRTQRTNFLGTVFELDDVNFPEVLQNIDARLGDIPAFECNGSMR